MKDNLNNHRIRIMKDELCHLILPDILNFEIAPFLSCQTCKNPLLIYNSCYNCKRVFSRKGTKIGYLGNPHKRGILSLIYPLPQDKIILADYKHPILTFSIRSRKILTQKLELFQYYCINLKLRAYVQTSYSDFFFPVKKTDIYQKIGDYFNLINTLEEEFNRFLEKHVGINVEVIISEDCMSLIVI
jgi:hypothetical protein